MNGPLELPPELLELIEKRELEQRREQQRRDEAEVPVEVDQRNVDDRRAGRRRLED